MRGRLRRKDWKGGLATGHKLNGTLCHTKLYNMERKAATEVLLTGNKNNPGL